MEVKKNPNCVLGQPELAKLLFAVLVKRLGGKVKINQSDIDDIAYNTLNEYLYPDGSPEFELVERKIAG
jgi:hypothetical protein